MAEALRRLGFDKVFDTKFGADLTIMEESNELIERLNSDGELPLITSCCPGWVKYAEHFYPDMLANISTCKSPHQMQGAIVKTYMANQEHIAKEKINAERCRNPAVSHESECKIRCTTWNWNRCSSNFWRDRRCYGGCTQNCS